VALLDFFDRAVRASFRDLGLAEGPVAEYLADLLARFARTEALLPRGAAVARLETVADHLLEIQAAWQGPSPRPEREVLVRRHLGDFTLFMTGIFPEHVARASATPYYVAQGRQAYRFVSEHDRASSRPVWRGGGPLYAGLAERFETYGAALDYARRVHFRDHPDHPFFRLAPG
jgi:hypothetical protein